VATKDDKINTSGPNRVPDSGNLKHTTWCTPQAKLQQKSYFCCKNVAKTLQKTLQFAEFLLQFATNLF